MCWQPKNDDRKHKSMNYISSKRNVLSINHRQIATNHYITALYVVMYHISIMCWHKSWSSQTKRSLQYLNLSSIHQRKVLCSLKLSSSRCEEISLVERRILYYVLWLVRVWNMQFVICNMSFIFLYCQCLDMFDVNNFMF